RLGVADDEAGIGRRVVVLHQLEEKAEPAVVAADRLTVEQALAPVGVDRALLAVRADEVGHGFQGSGARSGYSQPRFLIRTKSPAAAASSRPTPSTQNVHSCISIGPVR